VGWQQSSNTGRTVSTVVSWSFSRHTARKILTKLKRGRPSEATLAELIAGEFEALPR